MTLVDTGDRFAGVQVATPNNQERPHAERSASSLGAHAMCPGYAPQRSARTHYVTAQGNRGHQSLETGDRENLESDFEERMVQLCEAYAARFTDLGSTVHDEIRVETIEGRWGYTDRLVINLDGTAHLFDWKFVRSKEVVDAEHNLQGKDYVVGILEDARFSDIRELHVHFVMPRFTAVTHTKVPFTRADLPRLKLEILAILARARATDTKRYRGATLRPSYDACRYCGNAGRCVALRKIADQLGRAYDPDGYGKRPAIPVQTHASQVTDPAAKGQLQELASLMETWSASVRHHNLSQALDNPEAVPAGYELSWEKARRQVTSPEGVLLVAREFGLDTPDLLESASLSWTKVEQRLKDKAARGYKGAVVQEFNDRLVELNAIHRPEPVPRLVRARPAKT